MCAQIGFVDRRIARHRDLVATLPVGIDGVVPNAWGVQIAGHQRGCRGVEAAHRVPHGGPGARASGQTVVGAGSFDRQAPWLRQIADAVAPRVGRPTRGRKPTSNGAGRSHTEPRD